MDVVSPEVRSRMMSGIRGKDTRPEMVLRFGLHRLGLRFRLHDRGLPGKPDLVFPRFRAVVMVHGCFWHGHGCSLFRLPATRTEFWRVKIRSNRERDARNLVALSASGWRVATVWECALRNGGKSAPEMVCLTLSGWLQDDDPCLEIWSMDIGDMLQ